MRSIAVVVEELVEHIDSVLRQPDRGMIRSLIDNGEAGQAMYMGLCTAVDEHVALPGSLVDEIGVLAIEHGAVRPKLRPYVEAMVVSVARAGHAA